LKWESFRIHVRLNVGHVACPNKIKLISNYVLNTCKLEYHGNHGTIFRPRRRIPYEVLPHIDHLLRLGLSPKDVVNALREMKNEANRSLFSKSILSKITRDQIYSRRETLKKDVYWIIRNKQNWIDFILSKMISTRTEFDSLEETNDTIILGSFD
jgi:hypothetical protein